MVHVCVLCMCERGQKYCMQSLFYSVSDRAHRTCPCGRVILIAQNFELTTRTTGRATNNSVMQIGGHNLILFIINFWANFEKVEAGSWRAI